MRIAEYHFTMAQERLKRLEREIKEEYEAMSDKEKLEEKNNTERQYEKLCLRIKEGKKHERQIINERKMEQFNEMSKKAVFLARELRTDILVDITEKFSGRICFKTNFILFNNDTPPIYRKYFAELLQKADDVLVSTLEDAFTLEFLFPLYDEIQI